MYVPDPTSQLPLHPDAGSLGGAAVWHRVATGVSSGSLPHAAAERFAEIVTAALAEHVLGPGAVAPEGVLQSRLVNRFNAAAQRTAVTQISKAGIDCVILKGFAFAHTLYPEPEFRTIGDLDVLVQSHDRDRLIGLLGEQGYEFRPLPLPPWGFISTASYMPFVSADGACNIDIHIHPDCYPAHRSLTTMRVFADARKIEVDGVSFRVPSDTHAFLICATNVAKDKFGVFAARKIVDALLLLRKGNPEIAAAQALADAGSYGVPLRVFLGLLQALGATLPGPYVTGDLPRRSRAEFDRVLRDTVGLYDNKPGLLATLRRELTLCTEPAVGLHNGARRLAGLVRPGLGIPTKEPFA